MTAAASDDRTQAFISGPLPYAFAGPDTQHHARYAFGSAECFSPYLLPCCAGVLVFVCSMHPREPVRRLFQGEDLPRIFFHATISLP